MGSVTACFARVAKTLSKEERSTILAPLKQEVLDQIAAARKADANADTNAVALQVLDRMISGAAAPTSAGGKPAPTPKESPRGNEEGAPQQVRTDAGVLPAGQAARQDAAAAPRNAAGSANADDGQAQDGLKPRSLRQVQERRRAAAAGAPAAEAAPAAAATHQDPGEKPEEATPAVVAESLQKAAKREQVSPKQMLADALQVIDEAIARAPDTKEEEKDAPLKATISVPGDGTFKVINTKERLREFRALVERSPGFTGKNAKPRVEKAVTSGDLSPNALAREMLTDGEWLNAMEVLDAAGKPMMFGNGTDGEPIPYTDVQPIEIAGFKFFSGHAYSAKKEREAPWRVVHIKSGLAAGWGSTRADAVAQATKTLKEEKAREKVSGYDTGNDSQGKPFPTQDELRAKFAEKAAARQESTFNEQDRLAAIQAEMNRKERERQALYEEIMGAGQRLGAFRTAASSNEGLIRGFLNAAEKQGRAADAIKMLDDVFPESNTWARKIIADWEKKATKTALEVGYNTVKTGAPPYTMTWDEIEPSVDAQVYVTRNGRGEKNYRQWQEAHFEAVKEAASRGWRVPDKVLYDYPTVLRDDLNDDQKDLASDAMVTTYQQTKDYGKAVQAYRDWSDKLDLKGFTEAQRNKAGFVLEDGDITVLVNKTKTWDGKDRFQARLKNSTTSSGPNLTEQQAVDWADVLRRDMRKAEAAKSKEPAHHAELRERAAEYWDGTVVPAVREYLNAYDAMGAAMMERNRIKPEGMSARDWLESWQRRKSEWDGSRKTQTTGIQGLSQKDLWPTTDGRGERLRKAMLAAIKALNGAPITNSEMMDRAFGTTRTSQPPAQATQAEADTTEAKTSAGRAAVEDLIRAYQQADETQERLGKARAPLEQLGPAVDATTKARDVLTDRLASEPDDTFGLTAKTSDGRPLILTPSPQKAGQYQLTRFGSDGEPWGDSQYTSKEKAVDDFIREADLATLRLGPQWEPKREGVEAKKIKNFGEALPPARRAMAAKLDESLTDDDIANRPLSEIWPLAENEAIEDTFAAAVAHAARAEVPSKPDPGTENLSLGDQTDTPAFRGAQAEAVYSELAKDEELIAALEVFMVTGDAPEGGLNDRLLSYMRRLPSVPEDSYLTFYRGQPQGAKPWKRGWSSWTTNKDQTRYFGGRQFEVLRRKGAQGLDLGRLGEYRSRLTGEYHQYGSQGEWLLLNESVFGNRGTFDPSTPNINLRVDAADLPDDTAQAYGTASDEDQRAVRRLQARMARYVPGLRLDAVAAAPGRDAGQPLQGADRARVAAAELLRALTGRRAVFFRTETGPVINGVHSSLDPQVLFLRHDSTRPHMAVLGHEFLHGLRADRPDLYDALRDRVRLVAPGRLDAGAELQERRRKQGLEPLAADKLEEEFLADVMGDSWMDPAFWNRLASKEPSGPLKRAFDAALRFINSVLDKVAALNPFGTDVYLNDIKAARAAMAQALRDYVEVESIGAPDGNLDFSVGEAVDKLQTNDTARKLSERVMDVLRSDSTIGVLGRTVGTPYHLAHAKNADGTLRNPDLRRVYDEAQDYLSDINTFANDPAEMAPEVVPMLNKWSDIRKPLRLSGEARSKLARALFEGTLGWTRNDQGQPVETDNPHEGIVWTATELRERFGFDDQDIGRYEQARASIGRSLDYMAAAEVARQLGGRDLPAGLRAMVSRGDVGRFKGLVRSMIQAQVDRAEEAEDTDALAKWQDLQRKVDGTYQKVEDLKDRGYMPLMRFGPHTVTVRDLDTKQVVFFGMYETQAEANVEARKLRETAEPNESVTRGEMSQEQWKLFKGVTPETVELFGQVAGIERTPIFEEYIRRTKANHSALKRLIQRKGTPGFSDDVQRVLASFLTSNARAASANLHAGAMQEATLDIDQERGLVKDYATRLTEYVQNPSDEAQGIRGLMFVQFIGGSIASALVNTTQLFTMTLPYLSQYGPAAAAKALGNGMRQALVKIDPKSDLGMAMARAEKDGIVSPQALHELQGQAVNPFGRIESGLRAMGVSTRASEAIDSGLRRALFAWGGFFSLAEQFNRRATFIAAYQMAKEQGNADPFAFAEEAVTATQGVYNRGNRPQFARGPVGATVMTFKQFSIAYLEFLARMPWREKAIALAVLVVAAGLEGLPFADDLDDLLDTIAQRLFGKAWSTKREKVKFLAETLGMGRDGAEWVLRGGSALPGFPIDLAGRMSLGNMIPGTGLLRTDGSADKSSEILEALGPAGGVVRDALKGDVLPVALRNLGKGFEMARTGEFRDERGRKVADVTPTDAAAKMVGFQPASIARESRATRAAQSVVAQTRRAEADIVRLWAQGIVDNEPEKVAEARQKLADWNARNPETPIAINRMQLARMARDMRATREERAIKAAPKELRGRMAEELRQ